MGSVWFFIVYKLYLFATEYTESTELFPSMSSVAIIFDFFLKGGNHELRLSSIKNITKMEH